MKFEVKIINRNISTKDLLADLNRVANKLGKTSITKSEYLENGMFSCKPFEQRFSTWNDALKGAGLKNINFKNVSDEELFKNIEEVWIKLGRQPKFREIKRPFSKFGVGMYIARFETFNNALTTFSEYINSEDDNSINNVQDLDDKTSKSNVQKKHRTKREISDRLRFSILMRDGFTCKSCGASPVKTQGVELHVDHILPWSKGGETVAENLETKCSKCNLGKGNAFNK